jgi:hypothetical protein
MTGLVLFIESAIRRYIVDATESYIAERVQLFGSESLGSHEYAGKGSDTEEFKLARPGMNLSIIYKLPLTHMFNIGSYHSAHTVIHAYNPEASVYLHHHLALWLNDTFALDGDWYVFGVTRICIVPEIYYRFSRLRICLRSRIIHDRICRFRRFPRTCCFNLGSASWDDTQEVQCITHRGRT